MTLDDWQRRDVEIARLEALGDRRTARQHDELIRLEALREEKWRRISRELAAARHKLAKLEFYARQHRLPLGDRADRPAPAPDRGVYAARFRPADDGLLTAFTRTTAAALIRIAPAPVTTGAPA